LLALQANKFEMPIIFFVDSIIAESNLRCAAEWHKNRIAYSRNELAGDEKFFDLLDETMNDTSPEATERLVIFYICLGLGFTGWYANQPEYLRRKMETLAKRIGVADLERAGRICPEAYKYLDTRNLIERASAKIGAMALAFLGLSIVALAVNFYLFRVGLLGLTESLEEILRHDLVK
jgi:type VI protein secretion system component VasF